MNHDDDDLAPIITLAGVTDLLEDRLLGSKALFFLDTNIQEPLALAMGQLRRRFSDERLDAASQPDAEAGQFADAQCVKQLLRTYRAVGGIKSWADLDTRIGQLLLCSATAVVGRYADRLIEHDRRSRTT